MNNDNILDLSDLILVLKILIGDAPDITGHTGDVNEDQIIDLTEALYMMRKIAKGF
jgi:hypothetical protein